MNTQMIGDIIMIAMIVGVLSWLSFNFGKLIIGPKIHKAMREIIRKKSEVTAPNESKKKLIMVDEEEYNNLLDRLELLEVTTSTRFIDVNSCLDSMENKIGVVRTEIINLNDNIIALGNNGNRLQENQSVLRDNQNELEENQRELEHKLTEITGI